MILVLVVVFAFPAATAVFHFSEPISLEHEPLHSPSELARDIQKVSRSRCQGFQESAPVAYQVVQKIERGFQPAETSLLSGGKSETRVGLADGPSEVNIMPGLRSWKCSAWQAALRKSFTNAALAFDDASRRGRSSDEEEIESKLRVAVAHPPHMGVAHLPLPSAAQTSCSPDYTQCPRGWARKGNVCQKLPGVKEEGKGCATRYAFGALNVEQKQALAQSCGWTFPCQPDNCEVNFEEPCPSSWAERAAGLCSAPASYVGHCERLLNVTGLCERLERARAQTCQLKYFIVRNGARGESSFKCAMRGEVPSRMLCPLKASPARQVWVGGLALIPSMSVRISLRFAPKHGSCRECTEDMQRSQRLAFQQDFGVW